MAPHLALLSLLLSLVLSDPAIDKNLKAEHLRALASSQGGLISFSSEDFTEYVLSQPRPYTLVVLFTTSSSKYKCTSCEEVHQMFSQVSYSYKEAGADYPSTGSQKSRAVFFAVLEYGQQTHGIYQQFGFVSVPNILVTHPRSLEKNGEKFEFPKEDLLEVNPNSEIHAYKLIDFINSRSQRTIELKTSAFEAITSLFYLLAIFGTIGYTVFALKKLLLVPLVWFAGGMIVYCICMSGVVYNIIHGVPWIGTGSKGEPEYINTGQRTQYGLEGFIMSFIISVAGVALVGVNLAAKIQNGTYQRMTSMLSILVFGYCLYKIIGVYRVKASWYNPGMSPPHHYMRGPLIRDQGNSF